MQIFLESIKKVIGGLFLWCVCCLIAIISLMWLFLSVVFWSRRGWRIIIGYDQIANVCIGGSENETISSRCWRNRHIRPYKEGRVFVDWMAAKVGDFDHCRTSYEGELRDAKYYSSTEKYAADQIAAAHSELPPK